MVFISDGSVLPILDSAQDNRTHRVSGSPASSNRSHQEMSDPYEVTSHPGFWNLRVSPAGSLPSLMVLGCLQIIPSLLLLSGLILLSEAKNDFILFTLFGVAFVVLSLVSGIYVHCIHDNTASRQQLFRTMLVSSLVAWVVSVLILSLLSMTPLYLGRDNGDGTNGFAECILMVVLFSITWTPPMVMLSALTSLFSSRLLHPEASPLLPTHRRRDRGVGAIAKIDLRAEKPT